jgi:hypothetical protein
MKKIKILHVVSSFNPSEGGPPKSIENLVFSLKNKNFNNTLLTTSNIKIKNNYFNKICKEKLLFKNFYFPSFLMIRLIWNQVKKNEIIHLHNYWNFVIFFALQIALIQKKKIILTPHGCLDRYNIKKSYFKKMLFFYLFGKYQLKKINLFHYLSKKEKQNSFIKNKFKLNYFILSNYVNHVKNVKKTSQIKKNFLNFTYLGRLNRIKNISFQLLVISKISKVYKDIIFNIIGPNNNNERKYLNKLSKNLKIKSFLRFHEPIYGNKKYRILKQSDFVFLTSFYECNSMLALEVVACGGVLLTTKNCNLDFLIECKAALEVNTNYHKASKQILDLIKNKKMTDKVRLNATSYSLKYNDKFFGQKISINYSNLFNKTY